jgi:hypothetical protein
MTSNPSRTLGGGPVAALVLALVVLALLTVIGVVSVTRMHVDLAGVARNVIERLMPRPPVLQPIRRVAPPSTPAVHAPPEPKR